MSPKIHFRRTKVLSILTTLEVLEPTIENWDDHFFLNIY